VNDFVVLADSSELIDIPSSKRATGEGTGFVSHWPDFFNFIVCNVIALAAIRWHLVIEETT
jgi:hypothetical protein